MKVDICLPRGSPVPFCKKKGRHKKLRLNCRFCRYPQHLLDHIYHIPSCAKDLFLWVLRNTLGWNRFTIVKSIKKIASEIHCSPQTVRRGRCWLIENGLLQAAFDGSRFCWKPLGVELRDFHQTEFYRSLLAQGILSSGPAEGVPKLSRGAKTDQGGVPKLSRGGIKTDHPDPPESLTAKEFRDGLNTVQIKHSTDQTHNAEKKPVGQNSDDDVSLQSFDPIKETPQDSPTTDQDRSVLTIEKPQRAQETEDLIRSLCQVGVQRPVAVALIKKHSSDLIKTCLKHLPARKAKNPAAFLVREISAGGYAPPRSQKGEDASRVPSYEEYRAEELAEEELKEQEAREFRDQIDTGLAELSKAERTELRRQALQRAWKIAPPAARKQNVEKTVFFKVALSELLEEMRRRGRHDKKRPGLGDTQKWSELRRTGTG